MIYYAVYKENRLFKGHSPALEGNHIYYLAKCTVPAAETAYNIHAAAMINDELQRDKDVYSVKEYCMDLINGNNDAVLS